MTQFLFQYLKEKKKKRKKNQQPSSSLLLPHVFSIHAFGQRTKVSSLNCFVSTCPCADPRQSGGGGADKHFRLLVLRRFSVLFTLVIMKTCAHIQQIMGHGWRCKYTSHMKATFACSWVRWQGLMFKLHLNY